MAQPKSTAKMTQLSVSFTGGINVASSEWSINDYDAQRMLNFIFDSESKLPEVRPGTTCETATALGASLRAQYTYEKSTTVKYHIGVSGSKLYYRSGASLDAWTEIGSIASATVIPEFLTFNTKLIIADGGKNLKTWDATTYTTIANSPNASCLALIRNRIACNHVGEPDSVYLSAPNDETGWDTTTTAIGLKAGYGDNLKVNGLKTFGDDLIISKKGNATEKVYRLNTGSAEETADYWYIRDIPGDICAQNEQSMEVAFNNLFMFTRNGLVSLKGVQEYGDIQSDQIGRKINPAFSSLDTCHFLKYIPAYNSIWFSVGSRFYTARVFDNELSCTELLFNQGQIDSICIDGGTVYLGGANGYLYKVDETKDTDETAPDTESDYTAIIRSKRFNLGANTITLRRTTSRVSPLTAGTVYLFAFKDDGIPITLDSIALSALGTFLYDDTGYLNDATGLLYNAGAKPTMSVSHNKVKSSSLAFEIQATGIRFGIDAILADIMVTRGDQ
jgi:hypothetical protein